MMKGCLALLGAAVVLSAGCRGTDTETGAPGLKVTPDSISLAIGATSQLTVADGAGQPVTGATWSSNNSSAVSVSSSGAVTATAAGRAIVTASANGKQGIAIVLAAVPKDFSIDAQMTQAIQSADGSIPMVLGGNDAVVNVLVRSSPSGTESMQVVLRLFDANNALIRADTLRTSGTLSTAPTYLAPTVQFLVPSSRLAAASSWQVVRDVKNEIPDIDPSDDVFPRTGHMTLAKVTVPALAIRFVPIVLTAHGNATGQVTTAQLPEYLRTVKSVHPLGAITATIGTPFSTSANFGTPPTGGGGAAFWQQVLAELDLARVADVSGNANTYWMGILVPPPGYTFTAYGGFGYIPSQGFTVGAGTRTAIGVQIGWFARATQARDNVAHELGHNFGRAHAPCGAAASPDPLFPNAGGVIGAIGHDVFSWTNGDATSAAAFPPQTGDLMGYCTPIWISEYMYKNVLQFRGSTAASLQRAPDPVRSLIVRGHIDDNSRVVLEPAFTIVARPTTPERTGSYRLVGRAANGRELFSYNFDPATLDHAANIRHFLFAIPATTAIDDSLVTIEVTGAGTGAQLRAQSLSSLRVAGGPATVANAGDMTNVTCADRGARGVLVSDAATGAMLGTAASSSITISVMPGTHLSVSCSNGVHTTRSELP